MYCVLIGKHLCNAVSREVALILKNMYDVNLSNQLKVTGVVFLKVT